MTNETAKNCPICNKDNQCNNLLDNPQGPCWCSKEFFPSEIFDIVPPDQLGKSCICKECLDKVKRDQ